jgi:hypothetical protein
MAWFVGKRRAHREVTKIVLLCPLQFGLIRKLLQRLFAQRFFVQEEFGRADTRSAVKPMLNDIVLQ